jgi:hypothetical protein
VIVGANWQTAKMQPGDMPVSISRMKYMEHPNPRNLEMFIREYDKHGYFIFVPAVSVDAFRDVRFLIDLGIGKRHLHVRQAWEIGEHDPDSIIVRSHHEPIVPQGMDDPPVKALMDRKRARAAAEASKDIGRGKSHKRKSGKRMWRP